MSLFKWGNTFYCGSCRDMHARLHFVMRHIQPLCNILKVTFSLIFKLKGCKMKSLLWPLLLCSVAMSEAVSLTHPKRLYQTFMCLRPCPHVSGYFWIRNFYFPDSKISPSTRRIFKSNSPVHTYPMVSGFTLPGYPRLLCTEMSSEHAP